MRKYRYLVLLLGLMLLSGAAAAQLRQVAVVDIPGRPGFDSIAWAKGHLVLAHDASNTVDVFDPAKRRVVARIKEMNDPRGIAVDEQAGRVYVANAGDQSLAVISTADWTVQQKIPLKAAPDCLLFVPETHTLYIGNWRTGSISLLKEGESAPSTSIELGGRPERMIFDVATRQVYVTLEDAGQVATLDGSGKITHRWKLNASLPTGLALDSQSRRLFVAVRYAVVILNPDDGSEMRRVAAPAGIDSLWFDDASRTLYAGATGGSVSIVKAGDESPESEAELQTSIRGHTLAYDPVKKFVYMPGGREGRAKLVILKPMQTTPTREQRTTQMASEPVLPTSFPSPQKPAGDEQTAKAK